MLQDHLFHDFPQKSSFFVQSNEEAFMAKINKHFEGHNKLVLIPSVSIQ